MVGSVTPEQPTAPAAAPAEVPQPTSPRPLKARLEDYFGKPAQWYVSAEGDRWILVEALPGKENRVVEGSGLSGGVESLVQALIAFMNHRDGQFQDLDRRVRKDPGRYTKKGFRTSFTLQQQAQSRVRYAKIQQGYVRMLRQVVTEAESKNGWPKVELPALPWPEPPPPAVKEGEAPAEPQKLTLLGHKGEKSVSIGPLVAGPDGELVDLSKAAEPPPA
jgi:hypothetical protein